MRARATNIYAYIRTGMQSNRSAYLKSAVKDSHYAVRHVCMYTSFLRGHFSTCFVPLRLLFQHFLLLLFWTKCYYCIGQCMPHVILYWINDHGSNVSWATLNTHSKCLWFIYLCRTYKCLYFGSDVRPLLYNTQTFFLYSSLFRLACLFYYYYLFLFSASFFLYYSFVRSLVLFIIECPLWYVNCYLMAKEFPLGVLYHFFLRSGKNVYCCCRCCCCFCCSVFCFSLYKPKIFEEKCFWDEYLDNFTLIFCVLVLLLLILFRWSSGRERLRKKK